MRTQMRLAQHNHMIDTLAPDRAEPSTAVPVENSNSAILMMQCAKNRVGGNAAVELNRTREWSILVQ